MPQTSGSHCHLRFAQILIWVVWGEIKLFFCHCGCIQLCIVSPACLFKSNCAAYIILSFNHSVELRIILSDLYKKSSLIHTEETIFTGLLEIVVADVDVGILGFKSLVEHNKELEPFTESEARTLRSEWSTELEA